MAFQRTAYIKMLPNRDFDLPSLDLPLHFIHGNLTPKKLFLEDTSHIYLCLFSKILSQVLMCTVKNKNHEVMNSSWEKPTNSGLVSVMVCIALFKRSVNFKRERLHHSPAMLFFGNWQSCKRRADCLHCFLVIVHTECGQWLASFTQEKSGMSHRS